MTRVAILIDGDNIGAGHAERIATLGQEAGSADVRRVYADATRGTGWKSVPGMKLKHAGCGKNAADLLLTIDAMDLAHTGEFAVFLIASSDGDFSHLAIHLRESGHTVIGCGEAKAPEMFRAACTWFECLPALRPAAARPNCTGLNCSGPKPSGPNPSGPTETDQLVYKVIKTHSKNGSGIRLVELNTRIRAVKEGFKASDLDGGTWRAYLATRPDLFDVDPRGPDAHVRFKPTGFRV